ncbi:Peroxisome biogenesis factor 2 [Chionoecetes opilio]|uniref:RING-type E3 ubiquitin transferase (cysteine targeting) n=1 Tax=Chionoecetes opilio TaxID=41210 RepID=A0A8J4YKI1_CHIOP|nr:Peroxisome biogenesis factor 2 [Chionoecetes opilio]
MTVTDADAYAPRISQLDAMFLDSEMYSLVKSQLVKCVKYCGHSYVTRMEPEIDAALKYIILRYTVQKARRSVGQQLLQVKYQEGVPHRKLGHYITVIVLIKWLKERSSLIASIFSGKTNVKEAVGQCINVLNIAFQALHVFNLLVFLHRGLYPTVLERLFGLRHVSANPNLPRRISYAYFTRELLWHGFAELLGFILPLINVQYFHNVIKKFLPRLNEDQNSSTEETDLNFFQGTTCVICNKPPVLPHGFGCQHIACYFCIHSSYASGPSFSCPLCNHEIDATRCSSRGWVHPLDLPPGQVMFSSPPKICWAGKVWFFIQGLVPDVSSLVSYSKQVLVGPRFRQESDLT